MNKLLLMSQKTLPDLIRHAVNREPGITSEKLWKLAKDWDHTMSAGEFDRGLAKMAGELRCTNKCWYEPGAVVQRKLREPKVDTRQTRMF